MTRFALLTEFYPPDHGGIQATLKPLAAALGDQVTVVAPQPAQPGERRVVRSLFSGSVRPRWWWLVGWLRQAERQGLETAIFGHFSAAVLAAGIRRRSGLRYVILVHGNDLLSEQRRWYVRPLIGWLLRGAEFVGVNSKYVEQLVRAYRVPMVRIIHTHPFVLTRDIPAAIPRQPNFRLITVGRLVPRKNVGAVIRALKALRPRWPALSLDIVGDGPERERLQSLVAELNQSVAVTFHGQISEAEKWRLLGRADIFVMAPTVRTHGADVEGLGLVYLEAAAAGLPVVASDTGGIADAVVDGKTGYLINPGDDQALIAAVERLLVDRRLANQFGASGRQCVIEEFTDTVRLGRLMTALRGVEPSPRPRVAIIIPAYQSADTIGATLASVNRQTYQPSEVIVVDDGSTDDLLGALSTVQPNISLIRQKNAGAPAARNAGFERSTGDYVLFLDADTVLEPSAVHKMVVALTTHPVASYAYSDFRFGWKKFRLGEYSSRKLRRQNYIHTTSLIRRQDFPRFDPALKRFQDWDLWLTMDKRGRRGLWIPETLFRVRPRPRGLGMSTWLPSFVYRLPGLGQGHGSSAVAAYRQAEAIIRAKHRL
ncbi:MAG: glycosyltransferase [Patescibacteria group bacterium]